MTARVYSYWHGPQPTWIGLCLETLRRNCPEATLLDARVWTDGTYSGPIPADVILRQRPNVQSDYLRAWLLQRERAVWVDADCIVFRELGSLADHLVSHDFVAYRSRHLMCSALIAGQPGSEIGRRYFEAMVAKLSGPPAEPLGMLALGPKLLARAVQQVGPQRCYLIPSRLCHPLHWTDRRRMANRGAPPLDAEAYTWMMGHRWLRFLRGKNRQQILGSPTWAGELFRIALSDQRSAVSKDA